MSSTGYQGGPEVFDPATEDDSGSRSGSRARAPRRSYWTASRVAWVLVAWVAAVLAALGVYFFARSKGAGLSGDEPHYLVVAKALSHFSPNVEWAYRLDIRTHQFFNWPAGSTPTSLGHIWMGPHGPISIHDLGLPLLLMPFVAVGGLYLGLAGFFAIEAAGLIFIFLRASWLAGLTTRARVVFALALAGPALWLAVIQVYPDLLSGILLGAAIVELGIIERHGRLTRTSLWVIGIAGVLVPWLHVKNILLAALTCAALAAVAVRHRLPPRPLAVVGTVVALSWLLLAGYNLRYFGHLLGLPQPNPRPSRAGVAQTLGLLFDRQQGLIVQLPTVALGLIGLWLARRKLPISVIATFVLALALLLLNGSYVSVPYGGAAFAGRFQWALIPLLMAWTPLALRRIDRSPVRISVLGVTIAALWIVQAVPILAGRHVYFAADYPAQPWDPASYPGWWSGFNVLLPVFTSPRRVLGNPWFGVLIEVALVAVVGLVIVRLCRRRPISRLPIGAGIGVAAVVLIVLALVVPRPLPARPLTFSGTDLGTPLATSSQGSNGPAVALQGIGSGAYRATLNYAISNPGGSGTFTVYCTSGTSRSASPVPRASASVGLTAGSRSVGLGLRCPAGTLWAQLGAGPHTQLAVRSLQISKVSG
jgi:hypothetical protein